MFQVQSTLEELEWDGDYFRTIENAPADTLSSQLRFLKLKKFKFSMHWGLNDQVMLSSTDSYSKMPWLEALYPRMSTMTSLKLSYGFNLAIGTFKQIKKSEIFPKLEQYTVNCQCRAILDHFQDPTIFSVRPPITNFIMNGLTSYNLTATERIVSEYSQTLEKLFLRLQSRSGTAQLTFHFPQTSFPRLKKLTVMIWNEIEGREDWITPTLVFPNNSNIINYSQHFPVVEILSVWPWTQNCTNGIHSKYLRFSSRNIFTKCSDEIGQIWMDYGGFFDMFFSPITDKSGIQIPQIVPSLRNLDIPYISCGNDNSSENPNLCPRMEQLSAMFPMVHNIWMTKFRKNNNL